MFLSYFNSSPFTTDPIGDARAVVSYLVPYAVEKSMSDRLLLRDITAVLG
jgi:hypothetical protein